LTIHGDLYYEGKEFEVTLKEKRPGLLSEDLKKALGMPEGAPPPWLINMQRYGPPPSYPNLKIAGLNAPIPDGAQWGYHPGGWGKPPVDEFGRPLYGDVFGTAVPEPPPEVTQPIERTHWGEMEEEEEESSSGDEGPEAEPAQIEAGEESNEDAELSDGNDSVTPGLSTPATIELRKKKEEEEDEEPQELYKVLEQTETRVGGGIYGSTHKYIIPGDSKKVDLMKSMKGEKVSITLNPNEIEEIEAGGAEVLAKKYEAAVAEKQSEKKPEDVSDIIAEHSKKKRKGQTKASEKSKKFKEFKF